MEWLTVPLRDGRELDALVGGDPDGPGLLFQHGTPGDATRYETWFADAGTRGLRRWRTAGPGMRPPPGWRGAPSARPPTT